MYETVEIRTQLLKKDLEARAEKASAIAQAILRRPDPALTPKVVRKIDLLRAEAEELYNFFRRRQNQDAAAEEPILMKTLLMDRDFAHDLRGKICNLLSGASGTARFLPATAAKLQAEIEKIGAIAAVCLQAVDELRGEISAGKVYRREGEQICEVHPPELAAVRRTRGNILVADDNAHSREILVETFEREEHTVTAVGDGQAVLDCTSNVFFHLIVLDLQMPKMDGFQVLMELGRRRVLSRTSVIVISGMDDRETASAAIRLGARDFLLRPINLSYLCARVDAVVEERVRAEASRALVNPVHATFLSAPSDEYPPLAVAAYLEQLMEVGGDCYFHHRVGESCLLAGVADVSGDGWPAAMDMARVATLVAHLAPECTPENFASWLVRLNNTLHKAMYAGRNNLALTALLFDWSLRRVHVACFGQHPPVYRDAATGEFHLLPFGRQVRIGVRVLKQCETKTFSMALGSHWFVFSDGFTEAAGGGGKQLGPEGLISLLGEVDWAQGDGLSKVVAKWKAALPAGPRDDATLLAIEDRSPRPSSLWQGPATPEAIQQARSFLAHWMEFAGLASTERPQVLIGCDEILTNIVRHAYGGAGAGEIRARVEVAPECLRFTFEHDGKAISQAEALRQLELPQRPAGGEGLRVVHRVFTWVHFFAAESGPGGRIVAEKDFDWPVERAPDAPAVEPNRSSP